MFGSIKEILDKCESDGREFWRVILEDDMSDRNVDENESAQKMRELWDAMYQAAKGYDGSIKSASGLSGGDGKKMEEYIKTHECLCGDFMGKVITEALKMGESNACMKRIVAAPTAGACGVMPAILVPYYERMILQNINVEDNAKNNITTDYGDNKSNNITTDNAEQKDKDTKAKKEADEKIIKALYVAAGIGEVIARRASISGARGGCQAEIGSASAMAAGALTYLQGGNEQQIADSVAMALKNLLGLVCDPVAGLVEVPCVKRNVVGAVNAVSSSQMASAGIKSRIPVDEVIDAMAYVGDKMDESLKETGVGGLAGTVSGKEIAGRVL
ncbi:l-serine dehydratase [Clostridium sp. CAG:122]|jgi:L-serine dehydratase|uniref:L-serine ammonia-lyase, iron-sulfur-dependent, subunit beta n=1 Tax=Clostridia TaxID=186801 RepID=UPI00033794C2|nr:MULTISPECIES: L-serine ammonia-lyase, iron-sulfur-dependent, subunit alpha [Clostridia]MCQ5166691.1 L-serine ammonia-lyase, iron-sulfur-dependent, subunit alpha [Roseburia hominis]RHP27431.1 L-serine ammonia-lyase, iron-sulfur-dependent, subunit alpha [Clostridium sp. AF34-13]UYJ39853.1 MAG: L-serine ammonia-lyase, iron-sulfur-dependent, subunit alpha [Lachnospiraceae bacterium]CCZ41118.1 l-serine dehydratase [Clostridium sp. CAG:122]